MVRPRELIIFGRNLAADEQSSCIKERELVGEAKV